MKSVDFCYPFLPQNCQIFSTLQGGVVNKVWKKFKLFFVGFPKDMDEAFTYLDEAIF